MADTVSPRDIGESHHLDFPFTDADEVLADKLAWWMGMLAPHPWDSSHDEWKRVVRALRLHGLVITNAPPELEPDED